MAFVLHFLDVLNLRLHFSELSMVWRWWIVYLLIGDLIAAIGLWLRKSWGEKVFLLIAGSQLVAYLGFRSVFGNQLALILFHLVTMGIYFLLRGLRIRS